MSTPTTAVDGRTARRSRGMDQVLDAIIELFTEGNLDPSPEQVAALAGVSGRTVYRYFEDRNALVRAAIDRHFEGIAPLAQVPQLGEGTLEERIDRLVAARVRLFDAVGAAYRAASAKAPTDELNRWSCSSRPSWTRSTPARGPLAPPRSSYSSRSTPSTHSAAPAG